MNESPHSPATAKMGGRFPLAILGVFITPLAFRVALLSDRASTGLALQDARYASDSTGKSSALGRGSSRGAPG